MMNDEDFATGDLRSLAKGESTFLSLPQLLPLLIVPVCYKLQSKKIV